MLTEVDGEDAVLLGARQISPGDPPGTSRW